MRSCMHYSLTNVIIGNGVTSIGDDAFDVDYASLTRVYFRGMLPPFIRLVSGDDHATVYYLPGTTGWSRQFLIRAWSFDRAMVPSELVDSKQRTRLWGAIQRVWFHHLLGNEHLRRGRSLHEPGQSRVATDSNQHAHERLDSISAIRSGQTFPDVSIALARSK